MLWGLRLDAFDSPSVARDQVLALRGLGEEGRRVEPPEPGQLDRGMSGRRYLCTFPTDMCKGFDALAALKEVIGQYPLSGHTVAGDSSSVALTVTGADGRHR